MMKGNAVIAWTHLALAAIFEIAFALGMKSSNGFTNLLPPDPKERNRNDHHLEN